MTPIIIVAIGLLSGILMVSMLALLVIFCTRRKYGKASLTTGQADTQYQMQDAELVKASGYRSRSESAGFSGFSPEDDLPEMFLDPDWTGDAENLISHCIDLLKACHILTGRLVSYTMDSSANVKSPNEMVNIVTAAKDIQPRVDNLVEAMYTPSDSKQIEERSTALYKSVCHLLQVIQGASSKPESFGWADEIIVFMEKHMEAMQSECSDSKCSSCSSIQSTASSAEACQLCGQPAMVITNQAYCYSSHNPSAVL